ncbi:MAG TPA: DUF6222 family protein [Amycolatopsis sp.]|nr:DUF6222 family protein [Amycolatopsis sp.]
MTNNSPASEEAGTVPAASAGSIEPTARPMPRLGRGIRWSDIVTEIRQDELARAEYSEQYRDAA